MGGPPPPGSLPAVDCEEPRPFGRTASCNEQATAGAPGGELLPTKQVLDAGEGTASVIWASWS